MGRMWVHLHVRRSSYDSFSCSLFVKFYVWRNLPYELWIDCPYSFSYICYIEELPSHVINKPLWELMMLQVFPYHNV